MEASDSTRQLRSRMRTWWPRLMLNMRITRRTCGLISCASSAASMLPTSSCLSRASAAAPPLVPPPEHSSPLMITACPDDRGLPARAAVLCTFCRQAVIFTPRKREDHSKARLLDAIQNDLPGLLVGPLERPPRAAPAPR